MDEPLFKPVSKSPELVKFAREQAPPLVEAWHRSDHDLETGRAMVEGLALIALAAPEVFDGAEEEVADEREA